MTKYYIVVLWLALNLQAMLALATEPTPEYRLQPGDKIRLTVFGHPDASGDLEVQQNGTLTAPLVGALHAKDKTTTELARVLKVALDADYIVNPTLTVELLSTTPFYILGQVKSPGEYPYREGITVQQAIATAGGFTSRAKTSEVLLKRLEQETSTAPLDTSIQPGDTIEVKRRWF